MKITGNKLLAFAVFLMTSMSASAIPYVFTYTGEITSAGGALNGLVSNGDVVTIEVIADNGSASTTSQTWDVLDSISAVFTAGGYSATFTDGWFTSGAATGFSTDAAGNLVDTSWFGIDFDPTAIDTFGVGASLDLNNTSGSASTGDFYSYTPVLGTLAAWSGPVALVTTVDEPSALLLLGIGLLGIAVVRRKVA